MPTISDPFVHDLFRAHASLRTHPRCRAPHHEHPDIACQERKGHAGGHLARNAHRGILRWGSCRCGLVPDHDGACEPVTAGGEE